MTRLLPIALAAVLLGGCAGTGALQTDTAVMPLTPQGGPVMNQTEAIALASWALKDPANTAGNPERAARAIAAEDWLAGQSRLTGEFGLYAPVDEWSWGVLRRQVRAAIGVPANAPSQQVVDRLLAAADALKAGQTEAAMAQFTPPLFTLGPQRTLAALTNLPPLPGWARAFYDLDRNDNRAPGECGFSRMC
jgi:hypothetical protein